ncbi:MAG: hypothetical protein Q8O71_03095 [bacterium]|nr:hypothetical protein [bacterium]
MRGRNSDSQNVCARFEANARTFGRGACSRSSRAHEPVYLRKEERPHGQEIVKIVTGSPVTTLFQTGGR